MRHALRQALPIAITCGLIGTSFGALAGASGFSAAKVTTMSLLVFAGAAQFACVGVVAGGGSVLAGVVAGLVLNLRYVGFGAAVEPLLRGAAARRVAAAHLLIDESAAVALAEPDPEAARRAYWTTGLAIFVLWNVGTLLGVALGAVVDDPAAWGLDAALPAAMLAILAPLLGERAGRVSAASGAALALALALCAPAGLPVLGASAGALIGALAPAGPA